jgi:hypothetical protein
MIYLYYCFYNIAWPGLLVSYTVEICPYNGHAKGMCVVCVAIDAALFFNTYINPIALSHIHCKYYIVFVSENNYLCLKLIHWLLVVRLA